MKLLTNTPLKFTAFLTLFAGIFSFVISLYLLFLGLALLGIAGALYLLDALIVRKARSRKQIYQIEIPLSIAYLVAWFFAIMDWQAHTDIIFPKNFTGEAGIVFGMEGYPPLPKTRFWKKEIHLPDSGFLITSTKQVDLPNSYQFKSANGYQYRFGEIQISLQSGFPCLGKGKEIVYASYSFKKDSSHRIQEKLVALCNQINQGKANSLYTSTHNYVVLNVSEPYLHLQGTGLAYLPDVVADLPIKKAILTENYFTTIPDPILRNKSLETLLIGHNPIADIPQSIYELKNLKRLVINSTRIRNITTDLSRLDSLQSFDLSTNELDSLPKQAYNIPHLKELMVNNNRFKDFSFVDVRFNQLEMLYLYSNRVKSISKETKHLGNLKELLLFGNLIDSIPDNIADLQSLEKLEIWDNPILYISPKIAQLKKLQLLILDDDRLSDADKQNLEKWLPNCKINYQTRGKKNYF